MAHYGKGRCIDCGMDIFIDSPDDEYLYDVVEFCAECQESKSVSVQLYLRDGRFQPMEES